ncbi:hypothetical protein INT47_001581 [Mucor saturninus]|uniref:Uncharacterized protein n=1 Tax=Mucor saturninus TaxID=64648 RepID=A0A8H7QVD2_9FUNG|nr:hypothetical protein INT47_001581 [Mucor saturninus]
MRTGTVSVIVFDSFRRQIQHQKSFDIQDNYEQHCGDRITKFNEEKRKREDADVGRRKVKEAKGKGKSSDTRRGNSPK